jgi:hypothetical protein
MMPCTNHAKGGISGSLIGGSLYKNGKGEKIFHARKKTGTGKMR